MSLTEARLRLRMKWRDILCDLDPREVCDHLYGEGILNESDLELINNNDKLRKSRCRHLLFKVFLDETPQTIDTFFECLSQENYVHLCGVVHHQESGANDDEDNSQDAVTEVEMIEMSLSICQVWEDVGILVGGLTLVDIDHIKKYTRNPTMRPMQMLLKWRANAADKMPNVQPLTRRELDSVFGDIDADDLI